MCELRDQIKNILNDIRNEKSIYSFRAIRQAETKATNLLKSAFIKTLNRNKVKKLLDKIDEKFIDFDHINCNELERFLKDDISFEDLCNVWYKDLTGRTIFANEPISQHYHIVKKLIGDISLSSYYDGVHETLYDNLYETCGLIKDLLYDISDIANYVKYDWSKKEYGEGAIKELQEIKNLIEDILVYYARPQERPQSSKVLEIRNKTGAGIMDVKKVLSECSGDVEMTVKTLEEMLNSGKPQAMWKKTIQSYEEK